MPAGGSSTTTSLSTTNTGPLYITTTSAYKPTGSTTGIYTATSVAPVGTVAGTIVVASPLATAPCLNQGYLTQLQVLYVVDILAGGYSQVLNWALPARDAAGNIYNPALSINSLGYNVFDSYLYGTIRGRFPETLCRLGFDGTVQEILSMNNTLTTPGRYYIGDIDSNGQYYTGAQGQPSTGNLAWVQVNLNPGLPDYG